MMFRSGGYGSRNLPPFVSNNVVRSLLYMLYPPMPTLNVIPRSRMKNIKDCIFQKNFRVLNIGSGSNAGVGRRLWDNHSQCDVINMDLGSGDNVDLIGDAHNLQFPDNSFDAVVMQAVIEHLVNPNVAISEALRVLKPGGYLYIEVPFLQGFHADPHDYQRYTLEGLRIRLSAFHEIYSGVSVGPFCTFVWLVRDGFSSCFKQRWLYMVSRFLLSWLLSPFRYLDYFSRNSQSAVRLASEYYFLCQKP
jgi:SAM-dependent methyltransferase